jgi:hypothetical protein
VTTEDDNWRVEVDVGAEGLAQRLLERHHERRVAHGARERLGEQVTISVDAHRMFAYAPTEAAAYEAATVLGELATAEGLAPRVVVSRWHPEEERWEAPDVALPATAAERRAEHERLEAREREESRQAGYPEWEVEVEMPTREATAQLAARLEPEGITIGRRGHRLVLGAPAEGDARALAERLRVEVPEATSIEAKGSEADAWAHLHPFPYLGGLGG